MSIIAAFTTKAYLWQKDFEREEARADKTIQEIMQIGEAAGAWLLDKGDWADVANNCANAIDLLTNPPPILTNPIPNPTAYLRNIIQWGYPRYYTSCNADNFYIETLLGNSDYASASYIATKLANTEIIGDTTTITSIHHNTINPTLVDFLPLEGGVMTGDIDMRRRNEITNVADIELNGQSIKLGMDKYVSMNLIYFFSNYIYSNPTGPVHPEIRKPDCEKGTIKGKVKIITFVRGIDLIPGSNVVHWSAEFLDHPTDSNYWKLVTTGVESINGLVQTFCEYPGWGGSDK